MLLRQSNPIVPPTLWSAGTARREVARTRLAPSVYSRRKNRRRIHTVSATSVNFGGCDAEWISAFEDCALEVVRSGVPGCPVMAGGAGDGCVDDSCLYLVASRW